MELETNTSKPRPQVMSLTEAAADRIRHLTDKSGKDDGGLRVGVKNGGCAGMEYTMDWVEQPDRFDEIVEDKGVRVFIEAKAVLFLFGSRMDYQVDKFRAGFVFDNPNQTSACGCGESVELKPASEAALQRG
jgi:iron-sulfur cluster assembly protein